MAAVLTRAHGWQALRFDWWALHNEADAIAADLARALDR
jgi:hypothetical protein